MTFRLANVSGRAALCTQTEYFDLERISGGAMSADPMNAIRNHGALHLIHLETQTPDGLLATADLRAVVPAPSKSFAIGLNYQNHAAESNMDLPAAPLAFSKFPSCLSGPHDDVVLNSEHGDYEVELVVVIGNGGRDIAVADAWNHIMGVTIGQDISDRALQFAAKPPHFDLGKSRDTYGPIGPVIVSTDSFASLDNFALTCHVNGETRQNGMTSDLIFSVPALISYLSSILTLNPGDIIFTGTPEGVGAVNGTFLKPGDVIESAITGIGTMRNVCVA
jgi:2,4-didehydro-3-deoxy-L-rhamnonate hydrolase